MIQFECDSCGKKLSAKEQLAGKLIACPKCKGKVRIPEVEEEPIEELELEEAEEEIPKARKSRDAGDAGIKGKKRAEEVIPTAKRRRTDEDEPDEKEEAERRPRRLDDDDEDEDGSKKKKKKKKKKRSSSSGSGFSLPVHPFYLVIAILGFLGLITFVLTLIVPPMGILGIALGGVLIFAAWAWQVIIPFMENATEGLKCMFIPYYSLFYMINNFHDYLPSWCLMGVGVTIVGINIAIMAARLD